MASRTAVLISAAVMAVVVGALLPATAFPILHCVGDSRGWNPGVNYDDWGAEGIPVGEALHFMYLPPHNVVKVDEDSYNNCDVPNNAQTWTTGDDIVQLTVAGQHFFICSTGDFCNQGMKVAVTAI